MILFLDRKFFCVVASVVFAVKAASAEALFNPFESNTQELLRQQERERQLKLKQPDSPDVRLERPQQSAPSGVIPSNEAPCFDIRRIELVGVRAKQFEWAISAASLKNDLAVPRCLGSQGINLIMSRIQNAIIDRGYVTTRVLAAPQELTSGILELTLIPGTVRAVRFADDVSTRATQWNAVPLRAGDLLNLRDIEQALENFKRVPTVEADIQIVPAEGQAAEAGQSDLVITWQQREIPLRMNLSVDDSGSQSTGKFQGSMTISYDHWWTLNDLFYVSLNHDLGGGEEGARGTRGYTFHYSIPYGYWLFSASTSGSQYFQSVAGANQEYRYSGNSRNADLKVSRLIWRDAVRKTTASFRGWWRGSKNYIDDTEVEVQRRKVAGWEAGLNHREFIGSNTLDFAVTYRRGTGAMNALEAPEEQFGEGTSRLEVWNTDLALVVPFSIFEQRLRYSANWRWQMNRTPLVPQDRFSIGGRYTVRGFDGESSLIGERGWLVRNDLVLSLGDSGHEFFIAADYGAVGGPSTQYLLGDSLAGGVIGLRGGYANWSYEIFAGKPIYKPTGFKTAKTTAGFNLNWTY